jgi:hypothetical protein
MDEGGTEGFLHGRNRSGELEDATAGSGSARDDGETILLGEGADESECVSVGAVCLSELGAGETFFAHAVCGTERSLALNYNGHCDSCRKRRGLFSGGLGKGGFFAASENDAALGCEAGSFVFGRHDKAPLKNVMRFVLQTDVDFERYIDGC